jgi:hypothetical protein
MSFRSFQNKNKQHKENFMKQLGKIQSQEFEEEEKEKEFFNFIYIRYNEVVQTIPNNSEKEWADLLQYNLQDEGFETSTHPLLQNCFQIQGDDAWYIVSKAEQPSTVFKLQSKVVVVIHEKSITQYTFTKDGCVIKQM